MRICRAIKSCFLCLCLVAFTSSCSVFMALEGQPDPDLSVLRLGASREQVELQLGSPEKSERGEEGTEIAYYQYVTGDTPSPLRAVAYGLMDVATIFLWEFVGMYIEARQGTIVTVVVHYNHQGLVTAMRKLNVELGDEFVR